MIGVVEFKLEFEFVESVVLDPEVGWEEPVLSAGGVVSPGRGPTALGVEAGLLLDGLGTEALSPSVTDEEEELDDPPEVDDEDDDDDDDDEDPATPAEPLEPESSISPEGAVEGGGVPGKLGETSAPIPQGMLEPSG